MSKIIKASRIIGEYRLDDVKTELDRDNTSEKSGRQQESGNVKELKEEAQKKAAKIIEAAEQEAEQIITEAQKQAETELETARDKGYRDGFDKGQEEGFKAGIQELQEAKQTLKQVIKEAEEEMETQKANLPAEIIQLATKIAERIVNVELDINPELINNIIIDMLTELGNNHQEVVIKVNSTLIDYINKAEIDTANPDQKIEFVADNELAVGDCIVETDFGGRDGSLKRKLDLLEKELYRGAGYNEKS